MLLYILTEKQEIKEDGSEEKQIENDDRKMENVDEGDEKVDDDTESVVDRKKILAEGNMEEKNIKKYGNMG